MSKYLAQIATRNISTGAPSLVPAMKPAAMVTDDPFQQNKDDQAGQGSLEQNDLSLSRPNETRRSLTAPFGQNENQAGKENKSHSTFTDITYITRHINRLEIEKNTIQSERISTKDATTGSDGPVSAAPKEPFAEKSEAPADFLLRPDKKSLVEKHTDKIINIETLSQGQKPLVLEKKAVLQPSFAQKPPDNKTTGANNVNNIAKLSPTQPYPVQINVKNNRSLPKLVIGKIIVEVVQPAKPVAPKIINRVINAPSAPDSSKRSKLSFGLGQL